MPGPAGDPIALVLAAGRSDRAGRNKLLEVVGGATLIERTLSSYTRSTRVPDVVLVIPQGQAESYAWLRSLHVHLVENPHPEKGMISSIRTGLSSSWALERDFLIHPADVPFVAPDVVDRIVREFLVRRAKVLVPVFQGLGGHPGMFAAALRQEFFLHGDTSGTREVLMRHRAETVRLSVHDPDICFDVDTADDLRIAGDAGARWARVEREVQERRTGRRAPP